MARRCGIIVPQAAFELAYGFSQVTNLAAELFKSPDVMVAADC